MVLLNNRTASNVSVFNMATDDNTVLGLTYLVMSLLVMFSNGVVITVIGATRELHLPTLWNLAFMAACDFSSGLWYLILAVPSAFLNRFAYSSGVIGWAASIGTFLNGQNTLNVVLAILDRYISICWPMKYAQFVTWKSFLLAVTVCVILNIIRTTFIVFPDMDFYYNPVIAMCVSDFNTVWGILASIVFTTASFGTIAFCLIKIVLDISCTSFRVSPHTPGPPRHIMKFSFTVALSAGVFCISYIPVAVSILLNFNLGKGNIPEGFLKFSVVSLESNSLWNVIIYATFYKPFRNALLRMTCKGYYRRQRQMEAGVYHVQRSCKSYKERDSGE